MNNVMAISANKRSPTFFCLDVAFFEIRKIFVIAVYANKKTQLLLDKKNGEPEFAVGGCYGSR